jgi:hypothetical protein
LVTRRAAIWVAARACELLVRSRAAPNSGSHRGGQAGNLAGNRWKCWEREVARYPVAWWLARRSIPEGRQFDSRNIAPPVIAAAARNVAAPQRRSPRRAGGKSGRKCGARGLPGSPWHGGWDGARYRKVAGSIPAVAAAGTSASSGTDTGGLCRAKLQNWGPLARFPGPELRRWLGFRGQNCGAG